MAGGALATDSTHLWQLRIAANTHGGHLGAAQRRERRIGYTHDGNDPSRAAERFHYSRLRFAEPPSHSPSVLGGNGGITRGRYWRARGAKPTRTRATAVWPGAPRPARRPTGN